MKPGLTSATEPRLISQTHPPHFLCTAYVLGLNFREYLLNIPTIHSWNMVFTYHNVAKILGSWRSPKHPQLIHAFFWDKPVKPSPRSSPSIARRASSLLQRPLSRWVSLKLGFLFGETWGFLGRTWDSTKVRIGADWIFHEISIGIFIGFHGS